VDNRDALRGSEGVVLALRFGVLKEVIDELADALADKLVVVPEQPVGLDAQGNVVRSCPRSSHLVSCKPVAAGGSALGYAFGTMSAKSLGASRNRFPGAGGPFYATDDDRLAGSRAADPNGRLRALKVGGNDQSGRLEVGGDLHDL